MGSYKNNLISAFVNSNDICELLFDKKTYTEDDVNDIVYNRIFPYLYIDETQTEVLSYLCFEVDILRVPTNTVKNVKLIIWACSHKEHMKYSKKNYIGTRVDILADMVERELRDSDKFGIGKLKLESVNHFFPNSKYYGKELIYNMPDFKLGK